MTEADFIIDRLRIYPVAAVARMAGRSIAMAQSIADISCVRRPARGGMGSSGPVVKISRPIIRDGRTEGRAQAWRTSPPARVSRIMRTIAIRSCLTVADLTGPSKLFHIVAVRQEAMAAICDIGRYSLPLIGSWFGGRDHTTVLAANRRHKSRVAAQIPTQE